MVFVVEVVEGRQNVVKVGTNVPRVVVAVVEQPECMSRAREKAFGRTRTVDTTC